MKCGDCKHWKTGLTSYDEDYEDVESEFGECGAVAHGGEDHDLRNTDPRLALAIDGSGYRAALRCRSDFGCVLFEPNLPEIPDS